MNRKNTPLIQMLINCHMMPEMVETMRSTLDELEKIGNDDENFWKRIRELADEPEVEPKSEFADIFSSLKTKQ